MPETKSHLKSCRMWRYSNSQSVLHVCFLLGLSEALHFIDALYEDTTVDVCFLASVAISILAFTHHNKVVVCHFQILDIKITLWSSCLR